MKPNLRFVGDAMQGAHRARAIGQGSAAAWDRAAAHFRQDMADNRLRLGWARNVCLECLGWDAVPDGITLYLAGAIDAWRADIVAHFLPPEVEHLGRYLHAQGAELVEVAVESRPIDPAGWERVERGLWLLPGSGPPEADRLIIHGTLSKSQADGLVMAAATVARLGAWAAGQVPSAESPSWHGNELLLPGRVPAKWLLEAAHIWLQAWWVSLERLDWACAPPGAPPGSPLPAS